MTAFIVVSAGSADAATNKQCSDAYNRCMDRCDKLPPGGDGSARAKCIGTCSLALLNCSPWKLPPSSGTLQTPTGTTQTPPKGQGLRQPTGVSDDKQVGGGTQPKGKVGLDKVNVGGVKQLGDGWGSSSTSGGTTTLQRSGRGKKH